MGKTSKTRERIVEFSPNHTFLLFSKVQCIIDSSFVNKNSRVNEKGVKAMKTLLLKKYFLNIKEREMLEQELLEKNHEFVETVLEWDDEELLERIKNNR
ncbi:MAG: hypothetical protein ACQEWV_11965 [Bacillota bacterium]